LAQEFPSEKEKKKSCAKKKKFLHRKKKLVTMSRKKILAIRKHICGDRVGWDGGLTSLGLAKKCLKVVETEHGERVASHECLVFTWPSHISH